MGFVPRGSFSLVRPLLMGPADIDPPAHLRTRIVYLPRPERHGRSLDPANEMALLQAIRAALRPPYVLDASFKSYTLAEGYQAHDWRVDKERFRFAHVVIAPHGGAISNMIFAPPGAHLIEILPMQLMQHALVNQRPCFHALAYAGSYTYWLVQPVNLTSPWQLKKWFETPGMQVNISEVLQILTRIGVTRDADP